MRDRRAPAPHEFLRDDDATPSDTTRETNESISTPLSPPPLSLSLEKTERRALRSRRRRDRGRVRVAIAVCPLALRLCVVIRKSGFPVGRVQRKWTRYNPLRGDAT